MAQKKHRQLRAVVEVAAPLGVTEKQLAQLLKQRLPKALDIGPLPYDGPYMRVKIKEYGRVRRAEWIKEGKIAMKRYQMVLLIVLAILLGAALGLMTEPRLKSAAPAQGEHR